jgi:hypothetical protein
VYEIAMFCPTASSANEALLFAPRIRLTFAGTPEADVDLNPVRIVPVEPSNVLSPSGNSNMRCVIDFPELMMNLSAKLVGWASETGL